jgi:heme iron utilization protein
MPRAGRRVDVVLRGLLRRERSGVLATLSATHGGWPFASVAAYALNAADEPLLLLSGLAEHTHNLAVDDRASLFVRDRTAADPHAGARATLLGRVEPVAEAERAAAAAAYLAWHPQAARYLALADFRFYVLRPHAARVIGGFGDMGWIPVGAAPGG